MPNLYLEPPGFLGTGASLLADLTLLAYILLLMPSMIVGFIFARRKMFRPHHRNVMTGITIVNWILIVFLMLAAYRFDIADGIIRAPGNPRYWLPTLHGLFGLVAQILATNNVIQMAREDRNVAAAKRRGETDLRRYFFRFAKPLMRWTLALWLITSLLGISSYLIRYNVVPAFAVNVDTPPVSTPEIQAPVSTNEVGAPNSTADVGMPVSTDEASPPISTSELLISTDEVEAPVTTPEAFIRPPTRTPRPPVTTQEAEADPEAPVETPELEDDDSSGRGRGRGRGGDDDNSGSSNSGSGNDDDDDDG